MVCVYHQHLVWMPGVLWYACVLQKSLAAEQFRGEFGVEKGFTMCLAFTKEALVPI